MLASTESHLGYQAFEETCEALVLHHAPYNLESALWVLKVPVLYSSLDDIERCRDNQ
jgi:hypothetical protein